LEAVRANEPSSDIEARIREYVAALARPQIRGIAPRQQQVHWPDNLIAVPALLLPDQMTKVLLREVERQSNTPMPLDQRKKRIAELQAEIRHAAKASLGNRCRH
jgi:hypothetical protein